jgi:agmatine/peptidylarginine deiminase
MFRTRFVFLIFFILTGVRTSATANDNTTPLRHNNIEKSLSPDHITPPPTGTVNLDPEWGDCEGVLVRYPFNFGTTLFASMVEEIQEVAIVYILVANSTVQANCINYLTGQGVTLDNIEFIQVASNSVWIRDYGPWFVFEEDSSLSIIDMPYAWNPNWTLDDYFPEFLQGYWDLNYYSPDFWHDGGNMMTDGHGIMMMSNYVNEVNPGMSNSQICQIYQDYFGQDTIYIFQQITLDITGHIDLWAKIMNDTTILVAQMQPSDPNYNLIEQHAATMATIPTIYGSPFHIVRCPMPPYSFGYKSYLNSLIINGKALVPIYNLTFDTQALAAYQEALGPDWEVIGIDCNSIYFAGGAIHCTTIGVPRHEQDYLVDINLVCQPDTLPIVIPAQGGQFSYQVEIENLESDTIQFDFWTGETLPNGNYYGPILFRERLQLAPLSTITRGFTQNVPGNAPSGDYTFIIDVGSYLPRVISAEQSFEFTKSATAMGWRGFKH